MKRSLLTGKTIAGFTLAEVLITLTVIGVIAALTIPSLITNIQDAQNKAAFKRIYSNISAIAVAIMQDNAGSFQGVFTSDQTARNMFQAKLSSIKSCDTAVTQGCSYPTRYFLNGDNEGVNDTPALILNNGALLIFRNSASNCDDSTTRCTVIEIDVNGFNPPNTFGKDLYRASIFAHRLYPAGEDPIYNQPSFACNKTATYAGVACAVNVLQNLDY